MTVKYHPDYVKAAKQLEADLCDELGVFCDKYKLMPLSADDLLGAVQESNLYFDFTKEDMVLYLKSFLERWEVWETTDQDIREHNTPSISS